MIDTTRLAFGDSYTYVQGTAGRQNYSFIGDAQNYAYNPQTLLTDEIVQNQVIIFNSRLWGTICLHDTHRLVHQLADRTGSNSSLDASRVFLQNVGDSSGTLHSPDQMSQQYSKTPSSIALW